MRNQNCRYNCNLPLPSFPFLALSCTHWLEDGHNFTFCLCFTPSPENETKSIHSLKNTEPLKREKREMSEVWFPHRAHICSHGPPFCTVRCQRVLAAGGEPPVRVGEHSGKRPGGIYSGPPGDGGEGPENHRLAGLSRAGQGRGRGWGRVATAPCRV